MKKKISVVCFGLLIAVSTLYAKTTVTDNEAVIEDVKTKNQRRLDKLNPPIKQNEAPKKERLPPYRCAIYDPHQFKAYNSRAWDKKEYTHHNEIADVEEVVVRKKVWNSQRKSIIVILKAGGHIYRHNFIDCYKKSNGFSCAGEGDSGRLYLDKGMRMKKLSLGFVKEELTDLVVEAELRQTKEQWLAPQLSVCPEYVIEGRYVCYDKKVMKSKLLYEGCARSKVSCGSIGKRHFGHYGSDSAAEDAYYRCEENSPNQP